MPRQSKALDYEPCPACGLRRWKGLQHPVCGRCEITVLNQAWLYLRESLVCDNASIDVLAVFDKALVADCKELLHSAANGKPYRRSHIAKA